MQILCDSHVIVVNLDATLLEYSTDLGVRGQSANSSVLLLSHITVFDF